MQITQPGAWLLRDRRPLPDRVEEFLSGGEPPVYFGFGSMRGSEGNTRALIEAARALGLRSIISQGWGNLGPIDDSSDCLSVDDLSHERLFPRVAAVVHHGGAGTTTSASLARKPQVVVPHLYDQYYFAHRVEELRIGVVASAREELTVSAVTDVLRKALYPTVETHARSFGERMQLQGAQITADALTREFA